MYAILLAKLMLLCHGLKLYLTFAFLLNVKPHKALLTTLENREWLSRFNVNS